MDFQSEKSFGKLRLRAFQPYHQILCMLKHIKDVKDYLRHLRHALIYTVFDGMESPKSLLFPSSTSSTYIALQPLGVFDLSSTSSTLL